MYCNAITVINIIFFTINSLVLLLNVPIMSVEKHSRDDHNIASSLSDSKTDGWSSIHIYYGQREHLPPPVIHEQWKGSQVGQDHMVLALIKEYQRLLPLEQQIWQPYFVDLAANDATQMSNTFSLEQNGWIGLCIEPNPVYWERLAHRRCTTVAAFVGEQDLQPVNVSMNGSMGGIIGQGMDNKPRVDKEMRQKYTVSLQTVFLRYKVPKEIDYLSLDVEGAETLIMKDFPFDRYLIRSMTVERPTVDLKSILKSNGYEYIEDISSFGETFWVHHTVLKTGLTKENIRVILDKNKIK